MAHTEGSIRPSDFTLRPPLLSEFGHCLLTAHYFDSPHEISVELNPDKEEKLSTRIYFAEPDPALRQQLSQRLRAQGHQVMECCNTLQVLERMGNQLMQDLCIDDDVLISDLSSKPSSDSCLEAQISRQELLGRVIAFVSPQQSSLRQRLEENGVRCLSAPPTLSSILPCLQNLE